MLSIFSPREDSEFVAGQVTGYRWTSFSRVHLVCLPCVAKLDSAGISQKLWYLVSIRLPATTEGILGGKVFFFVLPQGWVAGRDHGEGEVDDIVSLFRCCWMQRGRTSMGWNVGVGWGSVAT